MIEVSVHLVTTHRMIISAAVHTATFFQRHTLVIAEDEAWVALATFHTHILTARWSNYTQTRLRTRAYTQRVGTVGRTIQSCVEER